MNSTHILSVLYLYFTKFASSKLLQPTDINLLLIEIQVILIGTKTQRSKVMYKRIVLSVVWGNAFFPISKGHKLVEQTRQQHAFTDNNSRLFDNSVCTQTSPALLAHLPSINQVQHQKIRFKYSHERHA